jgi:hypothetical protein
MSHPLAGNIPYSRFLNEYLLQSDLAPALFFSGVEEHPAPPRPPSINASTSRVLARFASAALRSPGEVRRGGARKDHNFNSK